MTPPNPFTERGVIRDPKRFFGRKHELNQIFERLRTMQSVSIVGERRIGKSSLLATIVALSRERLGAAYDIHYIDLQRVIDTEDFTERALRVLNQEGQTLRELERAIEGQQVILCLDEFEQSGEFSKDFFSTLRSLATTGNLALIVASQTKLADLASKGVTTSPFFNIFTTLSLAEMDIAESEELLKATAHLGEKTFAPEQITAAYEETKGNPWKLQLFGYHLYETENVNESKQRYHQELGAYNGTRAPRTHNVRREAGEAQRTAGALLVISAIVGFISMLTNSIGGIVLTAAIAVLGLIIEGVSMMRGKAA